MTRIHYPSPNHDERKSSIDMIVLHYTGTTTGTSALKRLCNSASKVSAHYLVEENGSIFVLVDEFRRAWHAGVASWGLATDVNSCSIGIELVNPGHEFGYRPFPDLQMTALETLIAELIVRYNIPRRNIVGHSDVAPLRKSDPGEFFDWQRLAKKGLAFWPEDLSQQELQTSNPGDIGKSAAAVQMALSNIGYGISVDGEYGPQTQAVVSAFQRRFRGNLINGLVDRETSNLLSATASGQKISD